MEREIDNLFSLALSAGVPPEIFWHGDPAWTWAYIRKWEEDQRKSWKEQDYNNWELGYYIYLAIAAAFSKDTKYPEEPVFYEPTREEQLEKIKAQHRRLFDSL